MAAAESRGLTIRYVLETHVHNDYVSGALEIRAATGAQVVAPVKGAYRFPHRGMAEGDEIDLGGMVLQTMETGHTPEHLAYLLSESGRPVAVFTGGSLLSEALGEPTCPATAAPRTSPRRSSTCAASQISPTRRGYSDHGAGSFCVATAPSQQPASTIGLQRRDNPAMLAPDEDSFVRQQLRGSPSTPPTTGTWPRQTVQAQPSTAACRTFGTTACDMDHLARSGAWIVDIRDRWSFAAAHVPRLDQRRTRRHVRQLRRLVIPFGALIVLVVPEAGERHGQRPSQLFRIGYEQVEGYLAGGVQAWLATGRTVKSYPVTDVDDLRRASATDAHRGPGRPAAQRADAGVRVQACTCLSATFPNGSMSFPRTGRSGPSAAAGTGRPSPPACWTGLRAGCRGSGGRGAMARAVGRKR